MCVAGVGVRERESVGATKCLIVMFVQLGNKMSDSDVCVAEFYQQCLLISVLLVW